MMESALIWCVKENTITRLSAIIAHSNTFTPGKERMHVMELEKSQHYLKNRYNQRRAKVLQEKTIEE